MDKIRFLFERDGDLWVAHCVEGDLVTHAPSLFEACDAAVLSISAHVTSHRDRQLEPFPFRLPAQPEVIEKFNSSRVVIVPIRQEGWPSFPVFEFRIVG